MTGVSDSLMRVTPSWCWRPNVSPIPRMMCGTLASSLCCGLNVRPDHHVGGRDVTGLLYHQDHFVVAIGVELVRGGRGGAGRRGHHAVSPAGTRVALLHHLGSADLDAISEAF